MKKEIEKEIKYLTDFNIGEFLVELAIGEFNFAREEQEIAQGMNENFGFSKTEAGQIAERVINRLRTFAKEIQKARAAAIQ